MRARREPSIGRVLTVESERKSGLGKRLVIEGINRTKNLFPNQSIRISAQAYLQTFYRKLGFKPAGEIYVEDGIDHIEMLFKN